MTTQIIENSRGGVLVKAAAAGASIVLALIGVLTYVQFRGGFTHLQSLTLLSSRAGLLVGPGSKVTLNGVDIGKVASISEIQRDGKPAAKFILEVSPQYSPLIPVNVLAAIKATTVFGGKYVALSSPPNPGAPITSSDVIDARSVSTEINTVFETLTSIARSVDPVKLNLTLSGAAQALSGLGEKFGISLVNGNKVLDNLNPQMDRLHHDVGQLAELGDVVADASPDLWNFLSNVTTTARTLTQQQKDLDATLLAAIGFANTGAEVVDRARPHLVQTLAELVPTSELLDTYSPELFCAIRNAAQVQPAVANAEGTGNGYSIRVHTQLVGGTNPYVYPDNLPRVNSRGGPGGAPGCWQQITRGLWPAPALLLDDGASIAPYNHFEIGSPWANEYVWGRQIGENTINP
ncbi:MCE-family protein MCE1A [Mycobacterium avium]|uniref:MCE-family protein MCE1A n=1 Tax=Mycobacterium avium TaxID=1764 RepID=A0A2A2ZNR8_MYCAV|nr:MCE family protein [Mycobacterium avium]MCA4735797.1 MCE family protein [Mycobacterium avium subsp. hominissuis]MCA4740446.1 MCE family protein [Mycobacterium avium subsp. hominissuis]MCA4744722.1 MCE family protein [Mycobacterium avium subsp. hominissuis]MCA4764267.1 MCE family protein [Mycobacterium avium subsp. hominissuis]PBA28099.1 MCE-family protein MCE1A [Mycobacterium avium]